MHSSVDERAETFSAFATRQRFSDNYWRIIYSPASLSPGRACGGMHVEERIRMLVEQLFGSDDLRTVQKLAVELQWAVYEHIEQLRQKLAETPP